MKEHVTLNALECEAVARGVIRVAHLRMLSRTDDANDLLSDIDAWLKKSIENHNTGAFLAAATDAVDAAACALIFAVTMCLIAKRVPAKKDMN
ncbi:MAG: hypothetical protein ABF479_11075 [Gluconacetobacter sp.]